MIYLQVLAACVAVGLASGAMVAQLGGLREKRLLAAACLGLLGGLWVQAYGLLHFSSTMIPGAVVTFEELRLSLPRLLAGATGVIAGGLLGRSRFGKAASFLKSATVATACAIMTVIAHPWMLDLY